LQFLPDSA